MNVRTPLLLALLVVFLAGCSDDDGNPTAPTGPDGSDDPDVEEILEPRFASIRSIKVDRFDATKGETNWDLTLDLEGRRPDVYATLQIGTSSAFYRSQPVEDAEWNLQHDLSTAESGSARLPRSVGTASQLTVSLFDDDGIGDDFMGAISFVVGGKYRDDNATDFTWVLSGSGDVVFRVSGQWVY